MAKIVRFQQTGGPENLKLEEATVREPAEGEAKMTVNTVGLNRAELLFIAGHYLEQTHVPSRIGYEATGTVTAVGPGVDKSWVGRKASTVPGYSMGKYGVLGEEAVVPASALVENPAKLSDVEAAASWMQYTTAYGALVHIGRVKAGDFVIIPAASSSVGLAAIQIAKAEGATAIAATRTSTKCGEFKQLGADYIIATEEEDLPAKVKEITGGKGARVIFDPVGGPFVEKLAEAAAEGGILFQYGGLAMKPTPYPARPAMMKGLTMRGYTLHEISSDPAAFAEAKKYIYDRLADGRFQPKVARTFPLAEVTQAYQYLADNSHVGKVVITVR